MCVFLLRLPKGFSISICNGMEYDSKSYTGMCMLEGLDPHAQEFGLIGLFLTTNKII